MLWSILPEFVGGFLSGVLGIILGFKINRMHETSQLKKRTWFILHSLKDELQLNLGEIMTLETRIKRGEALFTVFRTTTWDIFGNQLDSFKDVQFVLSLAILYWDLDTLNEAMKKAEDVDDLKAFYSHRPPFQGIEELLKSLKKGISATLSEIDKLLFEL